jgi:predicted dehydrogenase
LQLLRLGLVGLGGVSRFYLAAAERAESFTLTAVCDRDPARLEAFAAGAGVTAHGDLDALLAGGDVDAVVLDTPVATHVPLARAALDAGVHVCCEKPLALSVAEAEELGRRAAAAGRVLFTAFHRRYNRNLPPPASIDTDGLKSVRLRYLERIEEHTDGESDWYATPAAAGGGCIVDNGPNAVDVVRHLFGAMSVESARVERSVAGVDVRAEVCGAVDGGAEAVIELDWSYDGEVKDLRARWADGRELHADMLAGFEAFKSSLDHEYDSVLVDFATRIASGSGDPEAMAATTWLERVLALAEEAA